MDIAKLSIGQKVCYQPDHYITTNKWENGVIKEIPADSLDSVRVVYNCAGDWRNYKNYTSALTNVKDLTSGWRHDDIDFLEEV